MMKLTLVPLIVISAGNLNPLIVKGLSASNLQQYLALGLWCVVVYASFVRPRTLRIAPWNDTILMVAFYIFASLSTLWSNQAPGSAEKGLALLITTFGAYRLAVSMPLDEIIDCVVIGFFGLCATSIVLALLVPQVGVVQSWMHNGQWTGVFESKQSLGTAGAFLMFFASYRVMAHKRWLVFGATFAVAAASVLGSGSRGGGALAIAAIAGLYLSRRSARIPRVLAITPLLMILVAIALISYLVVSGNDYIPWFDEKLDFTERTLIWQHALRHFHESPVLGFGVNGFWTIPEFYYHFLREHGWVLDNFHSGYIALVVETGIVGGTLFLLAYVFWTGKILWLNARGLIERRHFNLLVNFTSLCFLINFTETFFLRSTNIVSILLLTCFFVGCQNPTPSLPRAGREAVSQPAQRGWR